MTEKRMKLRITVEGKVYDVEVERADAPELGSAASRVEGAAVGSSLPKMPARPALKPISSTAPVVANGATASSPSRESIKPAASAQVDAPVEPPVGGPRAPWHDLTIGEHGELLAPVPGIVLSVLVKVGDAVKANDPLVHIEVSKVLSPQEHPLVGTIRAIHSGTVADVLIKAGEKVGFGQALVKVK
jgi:glutaconyl-CoA/methylmalonyl-CoA decarboxylase subunit gamma